MHGILVSLILATTLLAQTPSAEQGLQRLRHRSGEWICQWHPSRGTPQALYGSGLALAGWRENTLQHAREHAQAQLAEWSDLLGLGEDEFREVIGARLGRSWSFTFQQFHRGLPVPSGRVDVRIHGTGKLVFLSSTAVRIPSEFGITPTLREDQATALGWLAAQCEPNAVPQPGRTRTPQLLVHVGEDGIARLAWEVPYSAVQSDGSGPIGRVTLDAHTGATLAQVSDKHECGLCRSPQNPPTTYQVRGYAHDGTSPVAAPNSVPLPGLQFQLPNGTAVTTDANGQFALSLTAAANVSLQLDGSRTALIAGAQAPTVNATLQPGVPATLQFLTAGSGEQPLAHTTAYLWTYRVNEFLRSILGNTPQLSQADAMLPTVNINSTCNAYYTGGTINFYRSGGGCNNTASASVIAHEWGHGLDDFYGGVNQGNGLSEGWGDIHSVYLLDDPVIGHGFYTSGGGIRNANNTRQYPTGSGVHAQGESWMGFAWKLRNNLRTTLGNAQAIAVSNDIVLGSIVANATDQASAVREVFLADDDDGNLLNGVPHYNELVAACNVHSLPYPAQRDGYITAVGLQSTRDALTPRLVQALAVPTFGSWQQVRLHYHDGQARVRTMTPTGQTNQYQALLPGGLPSQVLTYHFEALHQSGNVIRWPEAGEFSYATVGLTTHYKENFESLAPTWTHGRTTGSDDWQIGTPLGRSGASWQDPASAASGTRCAGTDLGLAGADGAYSPSSEMWLRSPPINCTGVTGLRLRFARWISADTSLSDLLTVKVNGQIVWLNAFAPMNEGSWTQFEAVASMADNQPSVVLEFGLRSDANFQYGGWNLDDVELFTVGGTTLPMVQLRLLPEQCQQGSTVTLSAAAWPNHPIAIAFADNPGPLQLPGVPRLNVGSNYSAAFGFTNGSGQFSTTFPAPLVSSAVGQLLYSHLLTLDANGELVASNPHINLFTF